MTELSPNARVILERAKSMAGPPTEAKSRVKNAVLLQIGIAATPGVAGAMAAKKAASMGSSSLVAGAGLGAKTIVPIVLLSVAAGSITISVTNNASNETVAPAASSAKTHQVAEPASVVEQRNDDSMPVPGGEAVDFEVATHEDKPIPTAVPKPFARRAKTAAASSPQITQLEAELDLLEGARIALMRNDPDAALVHLAAHRTRFFDGMLAKERTVLTARANCLKDRTCFDSSGPR